MKRILLLILLGFAVGRPCAAADLRDVITQYNASGGGGATDGLIGSTSGNTSNASVTVDDVRHMKFQPVTPGTVQYGHIWINDGNFGTWCVTLYNSSGAVLLSGSGSGGDNTVFWLNIDMGSSTVVAGSTDYYIGVSTTVEGSAIFVAGGQLYGYDKTGESCGDGITPEESTSSANTFRILFNNSAGDPS